MLDTLLPLNVDVGYGELGTGGRLGYEGKHVSVGGAQPRHALSAHPPSRLRFALDGRTARFSCEVALNDDVPPGRSHADFVVLADGRVVADARFVVAGAGSRELHAEIGGARELELVTRTSRWEFCHAVWLNPVLESSSNQTRVAEGAFVDCLERTEMVRPQPAPRARRCIATVVSRGFEPLLEDLLGSLLAHGGCPDALVVVLMLGETPEARRIIAKYGAFPVGCHPRSRPNPTVKAALYSIAHIIEAEQFLCLDADMLVLESLAPVFAAIEACPEGSILAVREGNGCGWHTFNDLGHALTSVYQGRKEDWPRLGGASHGEAAYSLVVNDGLFAGSKSALLALDGVIRTIPRAAAWTDERNDVWWRNQFVFNLALARLHCGVELDGVYNVQLNSQDVQLVETHGRVQGQWLERTARVLHFNGLGRKKCQEWRDRFFRVQDPLIARASENHYDALVRTLRQWIGRHGLRAMAWSFHGTADASSARIADPHFPLLACLHHLIRCNGCIRVLETGTARGVSAACLASAVARHAGGKVVTFDPEDFPERRELWAGLPGEMRSVIEARAMDSLAGLRAALRLGERFDAALLDSLHTEEHVWQEFELARQMVIPGGLILIHDAKYGGGEVPLALQRIEDAGYGVVRLWCAQNCVAEDDGLGLAVIENSRKKTTAFVSESF